MKFTIKYVHVIPLSKLKIRENPCGETRTFLMGRHELTFTRVP